MTHQDFMICPHCTETLNLDNNSLKCSMNHQFDIHKKGYVSLVKNHKLKVDAVYNKVLFEARRRFIDGHYYQSVYDIIRPYLKDGEVWCDLGSGEGSHAHHIMKDKSLSMIALDLSKDAIQQASDYLVEGMIPLVADLSHVPLHDKTLDGILNFLSPSHEAEMLRLLKPGGYVIKVIPDADYLKELRVAYGMESYVPLESSFKHFEIVDHFSVHDTFELSETAKEDLLKMSPLVQHKEQVDHLSAITIAMKVLILQRKESL